MARDTSKQVRGRADVEASFNASGLVVAARETVNPVPHRDYNPQISPDVQLLTQALSNFVPTLAREAREQADKKRKADFQAGIAYAKTATEEQLNNWDAYKKLQTPEFLKGFEHTNGAARAVELGAQLEVEFDQIKDGLVTPGQYDKWMSGRLNEALQGTDSPDFQQGFLESISRVDDRLRATSIENNYINIQQAAMADLMTATKGSMVSKMQTGDETWTDDLQVMRDKGRIDGLSNQSINDMQFELVEEVAVATGRPELFDMAFGKATPDVDNPDRMIPPLASSPKWSGRIADAKLRAESAARSKTSRKDEVAKLDHFKKIESEIGKGNYSKAAELADSGVVNGLYSAEKSMSFHDEIKKQREMALVRSGIDTAYSTGQYHLAPRIPGYTEKLEQEVVAKKSDDRWQWAGDDPIKQEQALEQDIIEMNNSGVVIPKYSEPFDYTASAAQGFQAAHALAKRMDSVAPGSSHRLMEVDVAVQHDFYESMLDEGMDPESALALTRESATPAKRESAARQMGFNRRDLEDRVAELVTDDAYTRGWNVDAMDTAYAQNTVYQMATHHIMASGEHADPTKSIEWAAERFKNTHTAMLIPGTGEAYYLENPGYALDAVEMKNAIQYVSDQLKEDFKDDPRNANEDGYYPVKMADDTYAMHHASGPRAGLPVMGKKGPWRVELRQLMQEYHSRDMMSVEAMKAQHAADEPTREGAQLTRRANRARKADPRQNVIMPPLAQ